MASKYFTVEVKPTIAASAQHEAAFGSGDVLFDWTSFQVPRGANRLINVTALVRPKGDAGPTGNPFPFQLVFSKSNTQSLGTVNGGTANRPSNDLLGMVEFAAADYMSAAVDSTQVADLAHGGAHPVGPLILQGDITTGDNVGYDTLHLGAICSNTSMNFTSILVVSDADIASAAHTTIVTAGTSMDNREHFIAGDVIHAQDDAVVGTLASVAQSAITLTSELGTSVLTNGDTLYNIHPIRLILQFER